MGASCKLIQGYLVLQRKYIFPILAIGILAISIQNVHQCSATWWSFMNIEFITKTYLNNIPNQAISRVEILFCHIGLSFVELLTSRWPFRPWLRDGFRCLKCENVFDDYHLLKRHVNNHHPQFQWKCRSCDAVFNDRKVRKHHWDCIHKIEANKERFPIHVRCDTFERPGELFNRLKLGLFR